MLAHWFITSLLVIGPALVQSGASEKAAVPVDPIAAIMEAFHTHAIVALDEGSHNNEPAYVFRLALIRARRFAGTVNDIVVEAGNSRYQDIMDRFVGGEKVPYEVLRQVWQNTTQPDALLDSTDL